MTFTAKIFPYSIDSEVNLAGIIRYQTRANTEVEHKLLHNYANVTQLAASVMAIEWKQPDKNDVWEFRISFHSGNILYA